MSCSKHSDAADADCTLSIKISGFHSTSKIIITFIILFIIIFIINFILFCYIISFITNRMQKEDTVL